MVVTMGQVLPGTSCNFSPSQLEHRRNDGIQGKSAGPVDTTLKTFLACLAFSIAFSTQAAAGNKLSVKSKNQHRRGQGRFGI
jgi:hypothetical protein